MVLSYPLLVLGSVELGLVEDASYEAPPSLDAAWKDGTPSPTARAVRRGGSPH